MTNATIHCIPSSDDDEPSVPGDGSILALYPANGSTNVGYDASDPPIFQITFDREVASADGQEYVADVDLTSAGAFAIYRASDDALIYKPSEYSGTNFRLDTTKKILTIVPTNNHALLDPGTEYYITMGEEFVKFADGTNGPAIEKGEWEFTTIGKAIVKQNEPFNYNPDASKDKVRSYHYSYDESWFTESSYTYQHDLAKMSICAAMAAYGTPGTHGSGNIEYLMEGLEFQNPVFSYPKMYVVKGNFKLPNTT